MTETVGLDSAMLKGFFSLKGEGRNHYILNTELVTSQRYNHVPSVPRGTCAAK